MRIQSITDAAFSNYGRRLKGYHLEELLERMKETPLPMDSVIYVPSSEPFLLPAGTAVELYATTLHYAPCATGEEGFRCVIVLPKGTNTELDFVPEREGEGRLITAKNKWLIAHPEAGIEGAHCGLKGKNITV